jgi:hypothetical protein
MPQGTYVVSVISTPSKSIASLANSLAVGDSVEFKINKKNFNKDHLNYIGSDNMGVIQSSNILRIGIGR